MEFSQKTWTSTGDYQCDLAHSVPIKKMPMFFLTLCLTSPFPEPLDLFFNDLKTPTINFLPYFRLYVNKHNVMTTYPGVLVDFGYTDSVSSSPRFRSTFKTKFIFLGNLQHDLQTE